MTFKLKALAAVLALAASSSAFALDGNQTTKGNSTVIFDAWDAVNGVSYTLDTGLHFSDLATGAGSFASNLAGDSNWTTFLAAASSLANVEWDVRAWSIPANQATQVTTILSTVAPTTDFAAQLAGDGNIGITKTQISQAASSESSIANHPGFTSGSYYAPNGDSYYAGAFAENWKGNTSFLTIGALGDTLDFYTLSNAKAAGSTQSFTSGTAQITQYAKLGSWSLSSAGALSYSVAVAAVPEPSEYAMFFAGLVVLGAVVRKRLNQAA